MSMKKLYTTLRELAITMGFREVEPDIFKKVQERPGVIDVHTINLRPLSKFAVPYLLK